MNFCKAVRILSEPGNAIIRTSWKHDIDAIMFIENDGEYRYYYSAKNGLSFSTPITIGKDGAVCMYGKHIISAWSKTKDWVGLTRAEHIVLRDQFYENYGNPDF